MSLLDRINQKNDEVQQQSADQIKSAEAENAKPDAVAQAREGRQNYGAFISQGSRQTLSEEQASPEEQEIFTGLEKQMAEIIYGEKAANSIIKAVLGSSDPVDGVAAMAHDVVDALDRKQGGIDPEILMALGETAVEQIVDIVEAASPDVDLTDTQMAESLSIAMTKWMESHPGSVDGDMMQYMATEAPGQLPPGMGGQQPMQKQQQPPIAAVGAQNV